MFKNRNRHRVPALNTTSTSDISFMLLIFFLVTTSIDVDKGLRHRLPPKPEEQMQQVEPSVKPRNVLNVSIGADNRIVCQGREVAAGELKTMVENFVDNKTDDPQMPERHLRNIPGLGQCAVTDRHVIAIEVDPAAGYDAYFNVQNTIALAYLSLRDRLSRSRFGHPYAECTSDERDAILQYYPQRISENLSETDGKEERP